MYGLYLIAVLVVVGGAIATLGDHIGRRIGRRKLTLLGLRPRYTSVLITVVTGVCIVAASIGTLTWLSNDVRTALFHMREIQEAYRASQADYAEAQAQLEELRYRVEHHQEYLDEIIAARDEAAAETQRLQLENAVLADELAEAEYNLEQWKRQVSEMQVLHEELQDAVARVEATKEGLERQVGELTERYSALQAQMRQGHFAYLRDDIVHAAVFEAGRSVEEIEAELLAFLEEAEAKALERGARIEGKDRAIEMAREEHFFQAAGVLSQGSGEWVVRAVALQNTVRGEPLLVYLHLFQDEGPIYRQGEVIAEAVVSDTVSDPESQVLSLLQQVQQDALSKGMITADDGSVGEVPSEKFVDALVQLRRIPGPATVRVVADEDTRITEGPLKVSLVVRPAPRR